MLRKLFCITGVIFVVCLNAFAVGESAVITLYLPAGAENTGLGETGVSRSNTVYSVFWNPANAATLYEETYTNHLYSHFHEDLLPAFRIPDLYHEFDAFSVSLNDVFPFVDFGYVWFENFVNMGETTIVDSVGLREVELNVYSDETVTGHCFGVRAFDVFSLGVSFKRFESRLAPGMGGKEYPDDGIGEGDEFDFGLKLNKRVDVLGLFDKVMDPSKKTLSSNLFYIDPAVGVSYLNFGKNRVKYLHSDTSNGDPLPRTGIIGGSCEFNMLDLIGITCIFEHDFNLLTRPKEETTHYGLKISLSPFFSILRGEMNDAAGSRWEHQNGYVYGFNLRKTLLMVEKVVKCIDLVFSTSYSTTLLDWDRMLDVHGFKFRPNIMFTRSYSEIETRREFYVREGQKRKDWTLGIGVVGSFPDLRKKGTSEPLEKKTIPETEVPVEMKVPGEPQPGTDEHRSSPGVIILEEEDSDTPVK